jgi:hypothetical protein
MINNTKSKQAFIYDLIIGLHAQQATGVNFDFETGFTYGIINPFMVALTEALHAATPPLKVRCLRLEMILRALSLSRMLFIRSHACCYLEASMRAIQRHTVPVLTL